MLCAAHKADRLESTHARRIFWSVLVGVLRGGREHLAGPRRMEGINRTGNYVDRCKCVGHRHIVCALMPLTDIDWAREGHGPGHWAETNWEDTGGVSWLGWNNGSTAPAHRLCIALPLWPSLIIHSEDTDNKADDDSETMRRRVLADCVSVT